MRIGGDEIDRAAFAAAVEEVAAAVPGVEDTFEEDERITQFEASTAAAFVALRNADIEVGVIEAGLGGRLDATNVLDSSATVLTSIGLDHTQWLGETELEIAGEKLAVLKPGSALVLGELSPEVEARARALANERDCRVIQIQTSSNVPYGVRIGTFEVLAPYLRRNLGVAIAAAETFLGSPLGDAVEAQALKALELPGRFELRGSDPPVIRDAAHNPDGAAALAEALRVEVGERPVVACLAVLGDKDATGIVQALAPALAAAVCTEIPAQRLEGAGRPGTTSIAAAELARLCEAAGASASALSDPAEAIASATSSAKERGGVALIAGSHYLLTY